MKHFFKRLRIPLLALTSALTLASVPYVWAGGSDEGPDEHQDDGIRYFGFVKDSSGKISPDAKVTAEIKGLGSVVTRSDKLGTYKFPGFGKQISPNNVVISCTNEGYRQIRTFNRTPPGKAQVVAIQVECTMQRLGAK